MGHQLIFTNIDRPSYHAAMIHAQFTPFPPEKIIIKTSASRGKAKLGFITKTVYLVKKQNEPFFKGKWKFEKHDR